MTGHNQVAEVGHLCHLNISKLPQRSGKMKKITSLIGCLILALVLAIPVMAADIPSEVTLFKNVNIFDGKIYKNTT